MKAPSESAEQGVVVHLDLHGGEFGSQEERDSVHRLTDRLAGAVARTKAGDYDGDGFGGGKCHLYFYGPDADRLMSTIAPILNGSALCNGGHAVKHYGPPGARSERVALRAH